MRVIKFFTIKILIISYFVLTLPLLPFFYLAPQRIRKILNRIVSFYSKLVLKVMGVKVEVKDHSSKTQCENYFIISNHMSYLDIMVMSAHIPTSFVTSIEMKQTPILGQIVTLAGCLFVERRSRQGLGAEVADIERALVAGINVTVFPEATSTNGEELLKFKRPLYQAAINSERPVLPITLNYQEINGKPVTALNRDLICWYGEMSFAPHLWDLCAQKNLKAHLTIGELIHSLEHDTASLRDKTFDVISNFYQPISHTRF